VKWTLLHESDITDSLKEDAGCYFSLNTGDFQKQLYVCYLDWNNPLAIISINDQSVVLHRQKTDISAGSKSIHETYSNGEITLIINIIFIKKSPEDSDELDFYDGTAYLQTTSGTQSLLITGGCGS